MDKYINKDCESNIGLELLANHDKVNKLKNNVYLNRINKQYNIVLDDFKKFISDKLTKFDPTKKTDDYDYYIRNIWFHYLLGNKNKDEYMNLFYFLGIKPDNDEDKNSNKDNNENDENDENEDNKENDDNKANDDRNNIENNE